ncbi:MAG: FISUMP domain-containing protein [Bacteroidales bacterium]|jgi:uncharacterized protein (TIGR02145 family)|nr:FISUMP domain-containing protein [Bacteroidales bacterium]
MKTTTIFKAIGYIILVSFLIFGLGCEEEEKNKLPDCEVFFNPREDVGATQGANVNIKIWASDADGEVTETALYINNNLVKKEPLKQLTYDWKTDFIEVKDYTIRIELTDNSNGQSIKEISYPINGSAPIVNFGSDVKDHLTGKAIKFTDSSLYDPIGWLWDFGDGSTSTLENPSHVYNVPGNYTVSLTATNPYGSKTKTLTDYITVYDTLVTDYDNNSYKVVKIGKQYWMAENLKTTHYADGTALFDGTGSGDLSDDITSKYYFAYDNNVSNVAIYGRLYTWAAVMNGAASSNANPSGVQGVCPDNWHVPSKAEWDQMISFLGGADIAGSKLKATGYDYWMYPNTAASNESEFNGLPGGVKAYNEEFLYLGIEGNFWSSFSITNISAGNFSLINNDSRIIVELNVLKFSSSSVRCVRD